MPYISDTSTKMTDICLIIPVNSSEFEEKLALSENELEDRTGKREKNRVLDAALRRKDKHRRKRRSAVKEKAKKRKFAKNTGANPFNERAVNFFHDDRLFDRRCRTEIAFASERSELAEARKYYLGDVANIREDICADKECFVDEEVYGSHPITLDSLKKDPEMMLDFLYNNIPEEELDVFLEKYI